MVLSLTNSAQWQWHFIRYPLYIRLCVFTAPMIRLVWYTVNVATIAPPAVTKVPKARLRT